MGWKWANPGCCCNCRVCFHVTGCAGADLSGVAVTLKQSGVTMGTGTTDSFGNACVAVPTAGTYDYTVAATHYGTATGTVDCPNVPTPPTVARVQHAGAAGNGTTVAATFGAATTAGNTLVAFIATNSSSVTSGPSGWSRVTGASFDHCEIWWRANAPSATSLTFNLAASNRSNLRIVEVSGLGASPTAGTVVTASNGSANSLSVGPVTASGAANYVCAGFKGDDGSSTLSTPTGGFTLVGQLQNGASVVSGYLDQTGAAGPYTAGVSFSAFEAVDALAVAFNCTTAPTDITVSLSPASGYSCTQVCGCNTGPPYVDHPVLYADDGFGTVTLNRVSAGLYIGCADRTMGAYHAGTYDDSASNTCCADPSGQTATVVFRFQCINSGANKWTLGMSVDRQGTTTKGDCGFADLEGCSTSSGGLGVAGTVGFAATACDPFAWSGDATDGAVYICTAGGPDFVCDSLGYLIYGLDADPTHPCTGSSSIPVSVSS